MMPPPLTASLFRRLTTYAGEICRVGHGGTVLGVKTLYNEPGRPWENGYIESFSGRFRDELLNVEIFVTLFEAQVMIENWRKD